MCVERERERDAGRESARACARERERERERLFASVILDNLHTILMNLPFSSTSS